MTDLALLIHYAISFLGTPYQWGGDDPAGLDCSGLVLELLKSVGHWPQNSDATAQEIFNHFRDDVRWHTRGPGSLAFYGKHVDNISHVAFCVSSKLIIEAAGGNSTTINPSTAMHQNAFVKLRPIDRRPDLVATLTPPYYFNER